MRVSLFLMLLLMNSLTRTLVAAEVEPASIQIKEQTWWVGQQVPFTVQLRAPGSFSGAAVFSLPEIPRVVIIKTGSPVVSSEEIEGKTWFVQTHDFALFSQQSGTVTIPESTVRFSHKDGFTGPVHDQSAQVPAAQVKIERPPGNSAQDFLVTTGSFKLKERWDPQPGSAAQGAVFQRTISQEADQVTGMALAPPPEAVPAGVRLYLGQPTVSDKTERGAFIGTRVDTLTYQLQEAGTWTLPAIRYQWWDPEKKAFGSQTLPAVTFEVQGTAVPVTDVPAEASPKSIYIRLAVLGTCLVVMYWQRRRIRNGLRWIGQHWNSPERVAARKLLAGCRANDPHATQRAWQIWLNCRGADASISPELKAAVQELQSTLYGVNQSAGWQGARLAAAFRANRRTDKKSGRKKQSALPALNPK
ncbi:protein BatD [Gimesia benthica]|uniref:Protein BatD n=1 Tax=Gimesia benthica TaxID=2608982 RepID=A0A6I6ADT3_9PLAN|nr:BatD family protein [Gimesia benthica]QGQ24543.1 protein BatD [Gimesia benthica]